MSTDLVVSIAGSPSAHSRSAVLLREAEGRLLSLGYRTQPIVVRDLPAEDLMHGRFDSPALKAAAARIESAVAVLVATPVYKAALAGVLKAFLDLLGPKALQGKTVLPIAVGGSAAHMLAVDYSLKPVLGVLGATQVLGTVYATDGQIRLGADDAVELDADLAQRLARAVLQLAKGLRPARAAPVLSIAEARS